MKYFPKNAKLPNTKIKKHKRLLSIQNEEIKIKTTYSLKKKFDLLVKRKYSNISDDHKKRIWHHIGTQILKENIFINSLDVCKLDELVKKFL